MARTILNINHSDTHYHKLIAPLSPVDIYCAPPIGGGFCPVFAPSVPRNATFNDISTLDPPKFSLPGPHRILITIPQSSPVVMDDTKRVGDATQWSSGGESQHK